MMSTFFRFYFLSYRHFFSHHGWTRGWTEKFWRETGERLGLSDSVFIYAMDIINCTPEQWSEHENEWAEAIQDENVWNTIPLLNVNELHNFKDKQLVRFIGMVQDMHGPEYYLEKFEVFNEETRESFMKSGKYVDIADCNPNEAVNVEGPSTVRDERQALVIISTPALNSWVKKVEEDKFKLTQKSCTSSNNSQTKRSLEDMEVDNAENEEQKNEMSKKPRTDMTKPEIAEMNITPEHLLNFPIPDSAGKVCHLKIYKNCTMPKLNAVCDFVGFLSLNPHLACKGDDDNMDEIEFQIHNPPPSLIPRLHCTVLKQLNYNNPLIGEEVLTPERMQFLKKELLILLTQLLLGDELAAEYLIYHLISEVYLRKDFTAIGKFSLNISNTPKFEQHDYVQELYKFIELLTVKSHYIPMTLDYMNTYTFIPKKDYSANRLTSSILQLSSNTHLILDETKLTSGKLNESGLKGVKALSNAIKNQKVMYDFIYYQIEFDCDLPFLVLSEGKSMLPSDVHIPLEPDEMHLKTFSEILEAARHFFKPELLNELRIYLTLARKTKYEITDSIQESVQNEYVSMRQKEAVTGDDLHSLLVLAKMVCISQGKSILDEECWKKACELEEKRRERIKTTTNPA